MPHREVFLRVARSCALALLALFIPLFAFAGSQTYTTPGTYSFSVPSYSSLTVQVWGGGGGGGAYGGSSGSAGGYSAFSSVVGYGGAGGTYPNGGAGGSASGGSTNTSGQSGGTGSKWASSGGAGANGGAGGAPGSAGTAPGGGGGSGILGGGGGGGGYSTKTYTQGQITGEVTVVAGCGGSGGSSPYGNGGAGARGQVSITWTDPPPPTCTVWADTNPLAYDANTNLRWTSSNATSFYINNVGYVTPNQTSNTSVGPLSTTNYGGTASGAGGSVGCSFTLTVNSPANCTFNGQTVYHGSFVTAYQSPSVPVNQTCNSQTRTCNNGSLSGNYNHASCTVSNPPPTATISVSPTSITQGQCTTVSWSSTNATSCTGTNFSTGGATSGSVQVCPTQSTTYSCSCTRPGSSTAECTGTGSGGVGATIAVSCTESYACTGAGGQTITRTNTDCSTTNLATCTLPEFCSAGSSVCLYNDVDGDINAIPRLVRSGETTVISWSTDNASSCTVTGNGDTWTGTSGTEVSSPITQFTTYTLVCDDTDADGTEDDFSDSISVYRVPSWFEF